jgi:23S rRNA (pseudouridine1915-N3)-methyltransferase
MRIVVVAVGRLKQGPERELVERYRKRAAAAGRGAGLQAFDVVEIRESRAGDAARRMLEEAIAIANVIPERARTVILDERGENFSSASLAGQLQGWRAQGSAAAAFIVGGPDGLAPAFREKAALAIAFGAATWPHQLARIMLLEQLYRAMTMLAGHPYHRA